MTPLSSPPPRLLALLALARELLISAPLAREPLISTPLARVCFFAQDLLVALFCVCSLSSASSVCSSCSSSFLSLRSFPSRPEFSLRLLHFFLPSDTLPFVVLHTIVFLRFFHVPLPRLVHTLLLFISCAPFPLRLPCHGVHPCMFSDLTVYPISSLPFSRLKVVVVSAVGPRSPSRTWLEKPVGAFPLREPF